MWLNRLKNTICCSSLEFLDLLVCKHIDLTIHQEWHISLNSPFCLISAFKLTADTLWKGVTFRKSCFFRVPLGKWWGNSWQHMSLHVWKWTSSMQLRPVFALQHRCDDYSSLFFWPGCFYFWLSPASVNCVNINCTCVWSVLLYNYSRQSKFSINSVDTSLTVHQEYSSKQQADFRSSQVTFPPGLQKMCVWGTLYTHRPQGY